MEFAPDAPVDLTNCDSEPIHIPSAIQPHGMLLAVRFSDMRILYASANTQAFLGVAPDRVLGHRLADVLGEEAAATIVETIGASRDVASNILTLLLPVRGGVRFDTLSHRSHDLLCVELEFSEEPQRRDFPLMSTQKAIHELSAPKSIDGLCTAAAALIRELSGYDRVMVYRFDADGNGRVVAEEKEAGMASYLGLTYPSSDIPQQARRMYILQRIRTIVDVGYAPVAVLSDAERCWDSPLDMTYCGLRSVSPIHIEYLTNMGVGATMGMSLLHNNSLWGMVICHHRTRRRPSLEMRALCNLLGQVISLLIGGKLEADEAVERMAKDDILESLAVSLQSEFSVGAAMERCPEQLLALVGADGAVVRINGETQVFGQTPSKSEASALMDAVHDCLLDGIVSSDEAGTLLPQFAHLSAVASGVLLLPILNERNDGILWLRGGITNVIAWAGRPETNEDGTVKDHRMSPRKSFERWEEVERGHSKPWRASETDAAHRMKRLFVRALLQNVDAKFGQLSRYDPLMSLHNRSVFLERLGEFQHNGSLMPASVLFLDLDEFKTVNDSLGHSAGDELLRQVARRLRMFSSPKRLLARLGGDEFVVFCEDMDLKQAEALGAEILRGFEEPFVVEGMPFRTTASIGIAPVHGDGKAGPGDPLRSADSAMYTSKRRGGNQVTVVEIPEHEKVLRRLLLEQALFNALSLDQFKLAYQPQFACATGKLVGFESLLRWNHPTLGQISPEEFIPMAERLGQIVPIGLWVLREALAQIRKWRDEQDASLMISVNFSVLQVSRPDFKEVVRTAIEEAGVPTSALHLEVTEGILMQDVSVLHLEEVRALGVQISIDDFGTGYSSLSYLQRLPIDEVKIDRALVVDIDRDSRKEALFSAIVSMAHALDAVVVAEGVEYQAQWNCLREHACDTAQGYLLCRPASSEEIELKFRSGALSRVELPE